MRQEIVKRTLAANGNELAERLLLITGYRSETTYDVWSEDDPEDRDLENLEFPDMDENCWFSVLGDNSMGTLVDIRNNDEGDLILTANFGDDGDCTFNVHTTRFLRIQKIVNV